MARQFVVSVSSWRAVRAEPAKANAHWRYYFARSVRVPRPGRDSAYASIAFRNHIRYVTMPPQTIRSGWVADRICPRADCFEARSRRSLGGIECVDLRQYSARSENRWEFKADDNSGA